MELATGSLSTSDVKNSEVVGLVSEDVEAVFNRLYSEFILFSSSPVLEAPLFLHPLLLCFSTVFDALFLRHNILRFLPTKVLNMMVFDQWT